MSIEKLASLRKERHWTQLELSALLKMSKSAYANIETGRRMPSVKIAIKIANALGSSVEELFGEATSNKNAKK